MTECPPSTAPSLPPATRSADERDPLIQRENDSTEACGTAVGVDGAETKPLAGGTTLGIHNLAIVMPQFIVCIILAVFSLELLIQYHVHHRLPL